MLGHGGSASLDGAGSSAARLELRCTALKGAPVGLGVRSGCDGVSVFSFLVARVGGNEGGQPQDDCFGELHAAGADLYCRIPLEVFRETQV